MPREGFPKQVRLRKRREYLAVQRSRHRVVTTHFIVYGRGNRDGCARVGITVSRKVGRAHQRNKIKRRVREAFRLNQGEMPKGWDLVLVARQGRGVGTFREVETQLLRAAKEIPSTSGKKQRRRRR